MEVYGEIDSDREPSNAFPPATIVLSFEFYSD